MKKSPILLLATLAFLVYASRSLATTSCRAQHTFLGFTADGTQAYWETQVGGDCDPTRIVSSYDHTTHQATEVAKMALDNRPADSPHRHYARQKKLLQAKHLWIPAPDKTALALQYHSSRTDVGCLGNNPAVCSALHIARQDKTCVIATPQYVMIETKDFPPTQVQHAYFNHLRKSWLLITQQCYPANMDDSGCMALTNGEILNNAVLIFDAAACDKGNGIKHAIGERNLRGMAVQSPNGRTYLVVDDNNGGACGPIFVDGHRWQHPIHAPGKIAPGLHEIQCGTKVEFEMQEGTTYHFDYWGP